MGIDSRQPAPPPPAHDGSNVRADNGDEAIVVPAHELAALERLATLGTLVGSVAHEFNNILTPMLSYAQMARSSAPDSDLRPRALDKAIDSAERASQICSSILGYLQDEPHPTAHVAMAVRDALQCLGVAMPPERIGGTLPGAGAVHVEVDVERDAWVAIRPVALQQVLINLILNARDALIGAGRGRYGQIHVAARCSTWNTAEAVEIRISDNGPGIPQELLPRLFQPFARGSRPEPSAGLAADAPPVHVGTGLGLAICKRLIESADGTIDVASEPGKGAAFTITLPHAQPGSNGGAKGDTPPTRRDAA